MKEIRIREIDIIRTFSEMLEEHFDLPIFDVIEDYPRPCFMTELVDLRSERFMTEHIDNYFSMKIYYFPKDQENNATDKSIMKDEIIDLFFLKHNGLIPTKIPLEIIELSFDEVKDVLRISVDFNVSHRIMRYKDKDTMKDLGININVHDKYEL